MRKKVVVTNTFAVNSMLMANANHHTVNFRVLKFMEIKHHINVYRERDVDIVVYFMKERDWLVSELNRHAFTTVLDELLGSWREADDIPNNLLEDDVIILIDTALYDPIQDIEEIKQCIKTNDWADREQDVLSKTFFTSAFIGK